MKTSIELNRRRFLGLALVLGFFLAPFAAAAPDDELTGTYKLLSRSRLLIDTGEVQTFGQVQGYITYGNGRVLVLIAEGNRPKAESLEKMTDVQRAGLFRTMNAYGGTYEFDGKTVKHHIDISANEVWTGTTQIRDIKKEDGKLIFTTRPAPFSSDGKMSVTTLVWEKVK